MVLWRGSTPSTRLVSIREGAGWSLVRIWAASDRIATRTAVAVPTRSERPQNRKTNHPRHDKDAASRLDDLRHGLLDQRLAAREPRAVPASGGVNSASRRVEAPSRHRGDSWPSHDDVGGLWSNFEPLRTAVEGPRTPCYVPAVQIVGQIYRDERARRRRVDAHVVRRVVLC
jgi:hypothetical protein